MQQRTGIKTGSYAWARRFYSETAKLRDAVWQCYFIGAASALLALLVRVIVGDALTGFPFLTFFSAVVISSFVCGWRAGSSSAVLGGLLSWYFLIEPENSFAVEWPSGWIALAFYVFTTAVIVLLTSAMHRSFDEYAAIDGERLKLNEELEARVARRTAELEDANRRLVAEAETRRAVESQIRQMQKMEAIGQLTGGIAHDFNNMLAIIMGSLDLVKRNLGRDMAKVERSVDTALEGTKRAADLTSRLLAFSRQQPLDPKPLDVNKVVSSMSEMLMRTIGETIEVETVLAGGLWRTFADPPQVSNVLINLCINSRDAMPDGGRLTIETSNAYLDDDYAAAHAEVVAGQYILLAVSDTGAGMTPDVIERAFDPFYTTKGAGRGTGLGLSQVYGFIKQSRGHVKIYSEAQHGTTVKVYLPRYVGEGADRDPVSASNETPAGSRDQIVLVVEDDERVRRMSVEALQELGYGVLEASGPLAALEYIRTHPRIDLLFTDIVMPDMNGRQLAETARQEKPNLKVLYTTGYTRNAIVHNGMLDPGIALLTKPFSLNQLATKVRQVLDGE